VNAAVMEAANGNHGFVQLAAQEIDRLRVSDVVDVQVRANASFDAALVLVAL
jgi:hypothetical protein